MRFKLGRRKPVARQPVLRLNNYLLRAFPNPPPTVDYSTKALSALENVYGNDEAGNCTVAAAYHIAAALLGNSNQVIPFVRSDALTLYEELSGWNGVPNDPSDTGLTEQQVLNYWVQNGLAPDAHKIVGFIEVDHNDPTEIQAAIWLFENIYRAASLPQEWIDGMQTMQSNFVWDIAGPGTDEGHAWMACGYDGLGSHADTWGLLGTETYASIAAYGLTYSVLSTDVLDRATMRSPGGFNWTQLVSDFQSLGPVQV